MFYPILVICLIFKCTPTIQHIVVCLENIASEHKAHTLNIELGVHSWLQANRLTLNVNITKHILSCKRKNNHTSKLNLRLNNDIVQSVTEFNF